jgi:DNA-binding transcriptional ArsR family regulator
MSRRKTTSARRRACCQDLGDLLDHRLFKALCDPSRIAILLRLAGASRPLTVSDVAEGFPLSVSVVSRHLAMLRDVGVLTARRTGKEVHYSVRYPELSGTLRAMADAMEGCCPA